MRDYVEIGIGREARKTYHLSSIALVPSRRTRSSKDVDTTWNIDAYTFDIPVVAHPTDAIVGPEFAIEMHNQGGLAVLNAEGLWARHADVEAALARVVAAAEDSDHFFLGEEVTQATRVLQELHSAPIDEELLVERITQIRESGATVAVRVSPQNARDLAPVLVKAGVELLFIQGTQISAEHVQQGGEPLNLKEFIGSLDVPVIAGGVSDYTTALHLMRAGAAGIIVGSGDTTSDTALGISTPMATAIADAAAARREYLDETGGRYVHVIADGEINLSGDIARAIACGADAVMLGSPLTYAEEATGDGYYWQSSAAHPRFPRGVVIREADSAERESLEVVLHGPSADALGTKNLVGGLRRAMAKCGYTDVKSFQKVKLALR
ncbi:GuaB3 family IMP dehydrogenase-related protein [Corynebacterium breve]|uniref:GuaB3 family IMP dehydrogenase-related protein n=1 Tax=Corynebacterium breve TaxID=3049799 RepID=A0ABY8VGS6_9CORY|nr:GuaB3 family IMP dehydrogenase-related protein [Corynebacterium breve]WIM68166.1 GuaB3 family IMP dehydrogenase-related protein [Corynebacterium breve]